MSTSQVAHEKPLAVKPLKCKNCSEVVLPKWAVCPVCACDWRYKASTKKRKVIETVPVPKPSIPTEPQPDPLYEVDTISLPTTPPILWPDPVNGIQVSRRAGPKWSAKLVDLPLPTPNTSYTLCGFVFANVGKSKGQGSPLVLFYSFGGDDEHLYVQVRQLPFVSNKGAGFVGFDSALREFSQSFEDSCDRVPTGWRFLHEYAENFSDYLERPTITIRSQGASGFNALPYGGSFLTALSHLTVLNPPHPDGGFVLFGRAGSNCPLLNSAFNLKRDPDQGALWNGKYSVGSMLQGIRDAHDVPEAFDYERFTYWPGPPSL